MDAGRSRHSSALLGEGWLFLTLETCSSSWFPRFTVRLSVFVLSHCRKTANAVQVTFVQCHILAVRCYLVSLSGDGRFMSLSDMSVYTRFTWNVLSFILFPLKPCFVGQAALPHFFMPGGCLGLGPGHWRSHWGRVCWVVSLFLEISETQMS